MTRYDIGVEDCGDHLELRVALPNARLVLNRFPGSAYHVEAVEFDGGEVVILDREGWSPPLAAAPVEMAEDFRAQLDQAVRD